MALIMHYLTQNSDRGVYHNVTWFCYCSTGNFISATPYPNTPNLAYPDKLTLGSEPYVDRAMNYLPVWTTLN
jgi:hypothetical protein